MKVEEVLIGFDRVSDVHADFLCCEMSNNGRCYKTFLEEESRLVWKPANENKIHWIGTHGNRVT